MTEVRHDILDALSSIDPASCTYDEWLAVGQALHHDGYPPEEWREWSRQDAERFDERDFERKWEGFGANAGAPVTGGTIVKMARDRGWTPKTGASPLEWDDVIGSDDKPIVDTAYVTAEPETPLYSKGHGKDELAAYLDALFEPDEFVGYVTSFERKEKDGSVKFVPGDRGVYTRTAGEIKEALRGGMENALGTLHDESGAWIRFNPLDGHGVGNANVASYRFCLVESDETEPAMVKAIIEKLNLPIAAMVHSGKKSMHAIVRVDAADLDEYRQRVERVYSVCEKNGIVVDKANKNPSRLSRMPGVTRNGQRQYLAAVSCGAGDYAEWEEWYAAETDELPDPVSVESVFSGGRPKLADELIAGVLRRGHKMLLSGPSKAGKSFALIHLAIALAEGLSWMGYECAKSRVLYVNLELDAASCMNRFADVYGALDIEPEHACDLDVWNLRGMAEPLAKLLPKMVRRGRKRGYDAVIIDPIYKVMTGDENSATDMTAFANNFDRLSLEIGCSVIYCHHHSKGYQEGKRSMDRASGSGVFARDPDAILDMVELSVDETDRQRHSNERICAATARFMEKSGLRGEYEASADAMKRSIAAFSVNAATQILESASEALTGDYTALMELVEAQCDTASAWRIDATLREFAAVRPIDVWFDWPLHAADPKLSEALEMGEAVAGGARPKRNGDDGRARQRKSRREKVNEAIAEAVGACVDDGVEPTRSHVLDRWPSNIVKKPALDTFRDWTKPSKNEWCEWAASETSTGRAATIVRRASGNDSDWGDEW